MNRFIIDDKILNLEARISQHWSMIQELEKAGEPTDSRLMKVMAEKEHTLTRELDFWYSLLPGHRFIVKEHLQDIFLS